MTRRRSVLRTVMLYGASLLIFGAYPLPVPHAYAEEAPVTDTATVAPTTTTTTEPTAPIAPSEPVKPASPTYTYDATTGRWNTDQWQYSSATGQYEPVVAAPLPVVTEQPTSPSSADPVATDTPSVQTNLDTTTTATITNNLTSDSTTGDAGIIHNTTGGNATTGTATATGTITNVVNSTVSGGIGGPATFTADINGDVTGDLILSPMIMSALLQSAATPSTSTTISGVTTADVTNNVNLNATSGDATVAGNTSAGGATSGDANAVANIINLINSAISAGSSFIGTININGNFNGDILISPDFIPQLLGTGGTQSLDANLSNTSSIVNNVSLGATTGAATVAGNTQAGSATSGTASTNLVLLNLTGHDIVAKDSLLVFVNVLGQWVGLIVDAAPGATSAVIGNGVTSDTAGNVAIDATTNASITNNVTLGAQSGDAAVTHNTSAGNATTGNATASANIANISQSQLSLTGWFGVLFINVFGSWVGGFGIDTPAGTRAPAGLPLTTPGLTVTPAAGEAGAPTTPQAVAFVPHQANNRVLSPFMLANDPTTGTPAASASSAPHAAAVSAADVPAPVTATVSTSTATAPLPMAPALIIFAALGLLGAAFRRLHLALPLS